MPYDVQYNATAVSGAQGGDNVIDSDGLNYLKTTGATSKAGRLVSAEYRLIDGVGFGNKAWVELRRAADTTENRGLLKRYLEEALKPLEDAGEIKDLVIVVDDAARGKGLGAQITFTDVRQGDTASLGIIPPWAINQ